MCCTLCVMLHTLLGMDVFCAPGPPAWLWSDTDALLGYLSSQVFFFLSAYHFLGDQIPTARVAVARFLRKWVRVASVGLVVRLVSCAVSAQPCRSWRMSGIPRRGLK